MLMFRDSVGLPEGKSVESLYTTTKPVLVTGDTDTLISFRDNLVIQKMLMCSSELSNEEVRIRAANQLPSISSLQDPMIFKQHQEPS